MPVSSSTFSSYIGLNKTVKMPGLFSIETSTFNVSPAAEYTEDILNSGIFTIPIEVFADEISKFMLSSLLFRISPSSHKTEISLDLTSVLSSTLKTSVSKVPFAELSFKLRDTHNILLLSVNSPSPSKTS